ncbi:MAG: hypothetical protein KAQ75_13210, partial [Bacteroidales bacterium]|nr:hypothetical protein [Bacteroidales bacterium]
MKTLQFLLVILVIINSSCGRKEFDNPIRDWFQDPPVAPITQTIKTVIPVGYAASLVVMDMKGYDVPHTKSVKQKSA